MVKLTTNLMVLCWKDKQQVYILTAAHFFDMELIGEQQKIKPVLIIEYNKNMGIVDHCDKQMSFNESSRRTMKYPKK